MRWGRRLVFRGVAAALGLVSLAGIEEQAKACGGVTGVDVRTVFPGADARDVPTNARVVVNYLGNAALVNREGTLGLRPMGGEVVAVDVKRSEVRQGLAVVLTSANPLQPQTQYEVIDNFADIPCSSPEKCIAPGPPRVISTFFTGVAADNTRPSLTGPVDIRMLRGDACEHGACCGPYRGLLFTLEWRGASDDHPAGVAGFNVYDDDRLVASMLPGPTSAEGGYLECEGMGRPLFAKFHVRKGTVRVRAADLAGNESEGGEFRFGNECSGCACAVPGRGRPPAALPAVALIAAVAVARRRSRR